MVANNVLLAQGLFRMVLSRDVMSRTPPAFGPGMHGLLEEQLTLPPPLDKSQPLRQHPWLEGATAAHMLALLGTARERTLEAGGLMYEPDQPAALYVVLAGALALRSADGGLILAREGAVIGLAETLAGLAAGWRATADGRTRVLGIDREDLFAVLCDHVGLMQSVFSSVLAERADSPNMAPA